jgi:hypothetical protein
MNNYISRFEVNTHDGEEERLWARILSKGDSSRSMSLLFIQKLCTATHEFEAFFQNNILDQHSVSFVRERLSNRIQTVLITLENNNLYSIEGRECLASLSDTLMNINSMQEFEHFLPEIHKVTHLLSESLENLESQ